jgi:hypothetical protein
MTKLTVAFRIFANAPKKWRSDIERPVLMETSEGKRLLEELSLNGRKTSERTLIKQGGKVDKINLNGVGANGRNL